MVLKLKPTTLSGALWDGGQGWNGKSQGNTINGLIKRCMLVSVLVGIQADKQKHYERYGIRNKKTLYN